MMRKKQLVQNLALEGRQIEVEISELANVKWFGETTVGKLKDNWINTIGELKARIENKTFQECGELLTPIQFKQALNYFIEHPNTYA